MRLIVKFLETNLAVRLEGHLEWFNARIELHDRPLNSNYDINCSADDVTIS